MTDLLLKCVIAGRQAAIPALDVRSVIEIDEITPIPGTPAFIVGLAALRSQALTVIDCALAIGRPEATSSADRRAAVVEHGGHLYALMVDAACDVGEALSDPEPVPGGFGEGWQTAARGLVETENGPTLLVDIGAIVAGPAKVAA